MAKATDRPPRRCAKGRNVPRRRRFAEEREENYQKALAEKPRPKKVLPYNDDGTRYPNDILEFRREVLGTTVHPTQKPVALYKWIISKYATSGDHILDTHVGSGSSRIAAYDAGLDFTGCELDYDYWLAQEERFNNHKKQYKLDL